MELEGLSVVLVHVVPNIKHHFYEKLLGQTIDLYTIFMQEIGIPMMAEQGGGEQVPVQTTQTGEETLSTADKEMKIRMTRISL